MNPDEIELAKAHRVREASLVEMNPQGYGDKPLRAIVSRLGRDEVILVFENIMYHDRHRPHRTLHWKAFHSALARILSFALAIMLTACQQPSPAMPEFMQPRLRDTLRAAVLESSPPFRGYVHELLAFGQSCHWAGPNPIIGWPHTEPRVGAPLRITWQLHVIGPAPPLVDPNGVESVPAVALMLSDRPMPGPPIASPSSPGCHLFVLPDAVLVPQQNGWLRYDRGKQMVTMEWTPASGLEGLVLFMQLLVAVPGANAAGLISSNGLEVGIGARW